MVKKLIILILLVIGISFYLFNKWTTEAGSLSETVYVVVPKGIGLRGVANRLSEAKVIDKPYVFMVLGRLNSLHSTLKAGEYQFDANVSMKEAMRKMANGEVFYHKITLPDGYTTDYYLKLIKADETLSGDISLAVKEGEMLPETYSFTRGDTRDSIILQAKKAMQNASNAIWETRDVGLPLKNINEMLALASIIEKETSVDEELKRVASVFINRLNKGMLLQTDPTVIYAITGGVDDFERTLKRKDLEVDNPYNTYKYAGLPPTPICNPSKAAMMAAVHPDDTDYLYFVATGTGGHNFSKTLDEHNRNVQSWISKIRSQEN